MECKSNSVIHSEDCDKDDTTRFKQDEMSPESQKVHLQQNEYYLEEGVWSSNVKTIIGIKQETWDPNILSSNIKSDPSTLDAAPLTSIGAIKCDVELDVKEEHFNQFEISTELQKLHLLQGGTYFVECDESSDADTKIEIKQEICDPNAVSSDANSDLENPSTDIITGTIKGDAIGNNEEPWCNRIPTDSNIEEKERESGKHEAPKDVLELESSRLPTDGKCINSLEIEKSGASHKRLCGMNASQDTCSPNHNPACDIDHFKSEQNLADENTPQCKSEVREKCSISKPSLKTDILLHPGKKPYKCEKCEKYFSDKSNLKRHMLFHSGTKPFKCEICDKCFTEKSNLGRHMLLHSGTKPFKCDICEKCFTWKSDLKRHTLLHSGKKPHKCDICEKCYTHKSTLEGHKVLHSGTKPYKCDMCEKCYTHKSNLQGHKLLHSSVSPYKCSICDKSFIWKSHLQRHTLLHSGTKPYKCEHCEKCFTDKSNLRQHILIHSGERPFTCAICEKCFSKKSDLKRHTALHSGKKS